MYSAYTSRNYRDVMSYPPWAQNAQFIWEYKYTTFKVHVCLQTNYILLFLQLIHYTLSILCVAYCLTALLSRTAIISTENVASAFFWLIFCAVHSLLGYILLISVGRFTSCDLHSAILLNLVWHLDESTSW